MSKLKVFCVAIMCGLLVHAACGAFGSQQDSISMLVVPARYSVMQVAFDMIARFPIVLVSYQGDASTENPLLHAWNGHEWVPISVRDYSEGNFLQITPKRTILVGDDKLLPPVLTGVSAWGSSVERIETIDTANLVNSLGAAYGFKPKDWRWFAQRFNLQLMDENAPQRTTSWYDQPAGDPGVVDTRSSPFQIRLGASKPAVPRPVRQEMPEADVVQPGLRMDEMDPVPGPEAIDLEPATEPAPPMNRNELPPVSLQEPGVPQPAAPAPARISQKEKIQPLSEEYKPSQEAPIKPIGWEEKAVATEIPVD